MTLRQIKGKGEGRERESDNGRRLAGLRYQLLPNRLPPWSFRGVTKRAVMFDVSQTRMWRILRGTSGRWTAVTCSGERTEMKTLVSRRTIAARFGSWLSYTVSSKIAQPSPTIRWRRKAPTEDRSRSEIAADDGTSAPREERTPSVQR